MGPTSIQCHQPRRLTTAYNGMGVGERNAASDRLTKIYNN